MLRPPLMSSRHMSLKVHLIQHNGCVLYLTILSVCAHLVLYSFYRFLFLSVIKFEFTGDHKVPAGMLVSTLNLFIAGGNWFLHADCDK